MVSTQNAVNVAVEYTRTAVFAEKGQCVGQQFECRRHGGLIIQSAPVAQMTDWTGGGGGCIAYLEHLTWLLLDAKSATESTYGHPRNGHKSTASKCEPSRGQGRKGVWNNATYRIMIANNSLCTEKKKSVMMLVAAQRAR